MTIEQMLAEMLKSQQALTETISARFAPPDAAVRAAEKETLVNELLAKMSAAGFRKDPAARKMQWGVTGKEANEGSEVIPFNKFLKAVADKDSAFLSLMAKAANGQSEGTNADGGYGVPVEYAAEIVKLERQNSVARQLARIFPMGSLTRKVPRELAKPTVYWTAEGTEPANISKGTLEQITQTAKKLIAIIPFTEELLEDNNVNYDTFIAEVVAQEMGREEDKQAFVGDVSGVSDPFNGVYFASGVSAVSLDGARLAFNDLVNLLMAPRAPYRQRAQFVLSTTVLKKIMKLVDDNNKPLWQMPSEGSPGLILGKRYTETDQIPDTLGTTRTNGTASGILFGAWDGLWISPRGGYTVKGSDSASTTNKSAFTQDEIWYKFRRRQDITVANPEAFGRMTVPAAA